MIRQCAAIADSGEGTRRPTCTLLTISGYYADAAETFLSRMTHLLHVERFGETSSWPAAPAGDAGIVPDEGVDLLLSLLNPVVIPPHALARARLAINIHPAPPEHPGVGCTSYALFAGDTSYGVTAHHMSEHPDAGPIIDVCRFPVFPGDDNESLSRRAFDHALLMLYGLVGELLQTGTVPASTERWAGPPRTWAQFRRWMVLSPGDTDEIVRRKVAAVAHPDMPGPEIRVAGYSFLLAHPYELTAPDDGDNGS